MIKTLIFGRLTYKLVIFLSGKPHMFFSVSFFFFNVKSFMTNIYDKLRYNITWFLLIILTTFV